MLAEYEALAVELARLGLEGGRGPRTAATGLGRVPEECGVGEGRGEQPVLGGTAGDDLLSHRAPFALVAVQQLRAAPALEDRGELPADVHRVADTRVEAVPAPRGFRWAASPTRKTRPRR